MYGRFFVDIEKITMTALSVFTFWFITVTHSFWILIEGWNNMSVSAQVLEIKFKYLFYLLAHSPMTYWPNFVKFYYIFRLIKVYVDVNIHYSYCNTKSRLNCNFFRFLFILFFIFLVFSYLSPSVSHMILMLLQSHKIKYKGIQIHTNHTLYYKAVIPSAALLSLHSNTKALFIRAIIMRKPHQIESLIRLCGCLFYYGCFIITGLVEYYEDLFSFTVICCLVSSTTITIVFELFNFNWINTESECLRAFRKSSEAIDVLHVCVCGY